jgi:hypothetical protein
MQGWLRTRAAPLSWLASKRKDIIVGGLSETWYDHLTRQTPLL